MLKFNDNGTISLAIDGRTYTLKRPTVKQMFDLWDLVDEISEQAKETLKEYVQQLAELKDDDSPEAKALVAKINRQGRHSYEHLTYPWLRKAFELLGDPLPEDLSAAPSELADPTLPQQILSFWRTVPLAHSGRRRN